MERQDRKRGFLDGMERDRSTFRASDDSTVLCKKRTESRKEACHKNITLTRNSTRMLVWQPRATRPRAYHTEQVDPENRAARRQNRKPLHYEGLDQKWEYRGLWQFGCTKFVAPSKVSGRMERPEDFQSSGVSSCLEVLRLRCDSSHTVTLAFDHLYWFPRL